METNGTPSWLASDAGQQLQATLSSEQTLLGLNRLLTRLDTLEKSVDRLTSMLEQGPGMVSMVTDIADESIQKASQKGVDIEKRLNNALKLAEKLTAPEMMDKLEKALSLADQLPGILSMVTDITDEAIYHASEQGIDIESRLKSALFVANKLTEPEMVEKLDGLLKLSKQAPGLAAMTVDIIDETMASSAMSNVARMLDPEVLATVGKVGVALTEAQNQPIEQRNVWGLLKAMKDPELQNAIGFLINFGKNFGKQLTPNS